MTLLSRRSLARVLSSLLRNELKDLRHGAVDASKPWLLNEQWPEDLRMTGDGDDALALDSLDLLRLAAATNEMFHLYEAGQELGLLSAERFGDWLDKIETAWRSGVERVTFTTSGSTGVPKRCTHAFSHLQTEIEYLAEVFIGRSRIVALTLAHHIYGFLFTAMLPDRLGLPVKSLQGMDGLQNLQPGDLVVSFPERWQWLSRTVAKWPESVAGVVSTAPFPTELGAALIQNGLESITEVYGSSESAGIAIRKWPEAAYHLMPHWTAKNTGSSEGALLTHRSGVQIRTGDYLNFDKDGSFTLAGRVDGAVQVGGLNVFPGSIAARIRSQPGVLDAVVRVTELKDGGRLKAFIVPQPDAQLTSLRSQLEEWISKQLAASERPRSIVFGAALPKDEMGKDSDW